MKFQGEECILYSIMVILMVESVNDSNESSTLSRKLAVKILENEMFLTSKAWNYEDYHRIPPIHYRSPCLN